jgi:hypothetical protein
MPPGASRIRARAQRAARVEQVLEHVEAANRVEAARREAGIFERDRANVEAALSGRIRSPTD